MNRYDKQQSTRWIFAHIRKYSNCFISKSSMKKIGKDILLEELKKEGLECVYCEEKEILDLVRWDVAKREEFIERSRL